MAADPDGKHLIVSLNEAEGVRFVRVPLAGGQNQPVPVQGDLQLSPNLASNAVGEDGRVAVSLMTNSWFWQTAILDPRTGSLERVLQGYDADLYSPGWASQGELVVSGKLIISNLWRFRRESDER